MPHAGAHAGYDSLSTRSPTAANKNTCWAGFPLISCNIKNRNRIFIHLVNISQKQIVLTHNSHEDNIFLSEISPHAPMNVCTLTVGTWSLQVWYDSEKVVHQIRSLLILQYAARGGVGRVYVRQVRQVHPWNQESDGERCSSSSNTQPSSLTRASFSESRVRVQAKWANSPSVRVFFFFSLSKTNIRELIRKQTRRHKQGWT